MPGIALSQDHASLTAIPNIAEICRPLFKLTNIDFFYFVRFFDDNSYTVLLSDNKWLQHKLQHEYMLVPPIPTDLIRKKFHYLVPTDGGYKQTMLDFHNIFHFNHPFDLIVRQQNYCDLYGFATKKKKNNLVNFYLNNLELLEKFTLYFKNKATNLITTAEQHKIRLPSHLQSNIKSISFKNNYHPVYDKAQTLLDSIKIKRHSYYWNHKHVNLTEKEISCLQYLGRGRAIKEIANYLQCSPRTIESRISTAKTKLGCYRKTDLIDFIEKNWAIIYE